MPLTETDCKAMQAAFWLLGVQGAWSHRGRPKWVDRQELARHYKTAVEVAGGGTFRGPLVIYELMSYVEKLSAKVTPPIRFNLR